MPKNDLFQVSYHLIFPKCNNGWIINRRYIIVFLLKPFYIFPKTSSSHFDVSITTNPTFLCFRNNLFTTFFDWNSKVGDFLFLFFSSCHSYHPHHHYDQVRTPRNNGVFNNTFENQMASLQ